MKNFNRALWRALGYRWRVAGLFFCALMVGVLWGLNIGTLYPLIEIAFKGQNPQQWITVELAECKERIARLDERMAPLRAEQTTATPEQKRYLEREIYLLEQRKEAEGRALQTSLMLEPWVRNYLPNSSFMMLALVVGVLLVGTILKSIFYIIHSILSDSIVGLTTLEVRKEFYRKTLRMDQSSFSAEGTSDLMSRFTFDLDSLTQGLKFICQVVTREPLKMAACFVGAAFICWRLLLFSLIVVPLGAFFISRLSKILKHANSRAMEGMSRLYGVLEETFQGVHVVKAFTMERHERGRFHRTSKDYYRHTMRIARYESLTSPLTEFIGMATISITLLVGAYLALSGETHLFGIPFTDRPLSLGTLLTFYGLLVGMSDPARKMSSSYNRLQRAAAAADRIYGLIDRDPEVKNAKQPVSLPRHELSLEFRDVEFSYDGRTPVLCGVNLKILAGETVAIVGPNGCGKSTLLQLLLRFYDPTAGSILLDGINLRDLRIRELRQQIGLVTQEAVLFQDTVLNNIRYGNPHATREQAIAAAHQAHAHRFIEEKLPDGYDTMLAERGTSLSGGQRQRIALARAILRDPALFILDEATSQIDLESEQLIHLALEQFARKRTTLIVTHRLSTLSLADRIVVMQAGEVIDFGPHHLLLQRCEFYQRLHDIPLRESA